MNLLFVVPSIFQEWDFLSNVLCVGEKNYVKKQKQLIKNNPIC